MYVSCAHILSSWESYGNEGLKEKEREYKVPKIYFLLFPTLQNSGTGES